MRQGPSKAKKGLVAVLAAMLLTLAVPGTADAAAQQKQQNVWKPFTLKLHDIDVCVKGRINGTVKYTFTPRPSGRYADKITNVQIENPKATLEMYKMNGSTCTNDRTNVGKVTMKHRWTGSKCQSNARIGVSFPWGVSASFWPSCGTVNQAARTTTYTADYWRYVQSNTGSPVRYDGTYSFRYSSQRPCFGLGLDATVHPKGQEWRSDTASTSMKVCL